MKCALIFPGNLASYIECIDNFVKFSYTYDVDVYILYSKQINYVHSFNEQNINIEVTQQDIDKIKSKFNKNIKYFEAIEDVNNYSTLLTNQREAFKEKIIWTKNLNLMTLFRYEDFINSEHRTNKYLDQFVRTNFLYQKIKDSNIKYDYIIRSRIDQYVDLNLLHKIIKTINNQKEIIPIISSCMDNFYVIGKTHFNFFDYLINEMGDEKLNYINSKDKYILGPEVQFRSLERTFFDKIKILNLSEIVNIEISFTILDSNNLYFYTCKNTQGLCYGKYILNNNINISNYKEKLNSDTNFKILPSKYNASYNGHVIKIYTVLTRDFFN
uniref:Uncharacterized protein n=1 Tax=viral metagenome TaxID=1070528 RepID=A0A6C0E314_9ZZZZ